MRKYVEHAQSVIDASPQMDEANTKAAVLREFLELLEWKIPSNTQLEYSVKAFGKTYKVDYALVLEGAPIAFLEAKGVDTSLTKKHRDQLAAYLKNEDVNWGILTNGEEYEFFRRQVIDSKVIVNALANTQLQSLPDRVTVLRAFTKDAIQTGDSEKIATRINELRSARATLKSEKDDLAAEITKLVSGSVSDTVSSHVESQSKEMIDRLVQEIDEEIDSDGATSSEEDDGISRHTPTDDFQEVSGEYVIKILSHGTPIAVFGDDNQSNVMADVVNYLIQTHNLISEIEPMPYIPGRKKAIINDQPTSPHDEQAMRFYRELSEGYYLDTHMDKATKCRTLKRLANTLDLEIEFEQGW